MLWGLKILYFLLDKVWKIVFPLILIKSFQKKYVSKNRTRYLNIYMELFIKLIRHSKGGNLNMC